MPFLQFGYFSCKNEFSQYMQKHKWQCSICWPWQHTQELLHSPSTISAWPQLRRLFLFLYSPLRFCKLSLGMICETYSPKIILLMDLSLLASCTSSLHLVPNPDPETLASFVLAAQHNLRMTQNLGK